jgi:hypothetical protein
MTHTLTLEYKNPKTSMHYLSHEFLSALTQEFPLENFVETGTFMGHTTEIAMHYFSTINTIELNPEYYYQVCEKFAPYAHVHSHWGDSGKMLRTIVPKLQGQTLFWLDAHFSGSDTAFAGCGTPIMQELKAIRDTGSQEHAIILIDDIRLFDLIPHRESADAGQSFPDMPAIFTALREINPHFSFALLGDTLMAFSSNTNLTVSPVVQACTLSRLSNCLTLNDDEIKQLETTIFSASESEKKTFGELHNMYCHPESNSPSPYYHVWFGLSLMANKQYVQAAQQFERAIALNYNPPRVLEYLQEAQENMNVHLEHIYNLQELIGKYEEERQILIHNHNNMYQYILHLQALNNQYQQELMNLKQQIV